MPKWADRASEQQQRHNDRREVILQAAALCFNRKGYHGTTIEDVAAELKVSKATLYYYFKNKEDLLFQCHEESLDIGVEALRLAEATGGTPAERLSSVLQYSIEHMTGRFKGCVLLLEDGMLSPHLHRRIVQRRDEYEGRIRQLIDAGTACGQFVPCDAKVITFAMLGAMMWVLKWYDPKGPMSPKEIAAKFAAYLTRGLLAVPTEPRQESVSYRASEPQSAGGVIKQRGRSEMPPSAPPESPEPSPYRRADTGERAAAAGRTAGRRVNRLRSN